ncbi:MAG: metallophosphoesterase [Chloroflexota bacterium]
MTKIIEKIPALLPTDSSGHQFVWYADSCSGVPDARHESTLSAVNNIVACLDPPPEFICFPGDEIIGLSADERILREQWRYWFEHEMAWLDREKIPLYHTTGNHTAYDEVSANVYRDVMAHLPQNGPPTGKGLSYFVQRDDLLMIFLDTMGVGLGGEGRVETAWLEQTLITHANVPRKLVFGHHPIHSVNGFSGPYQRDVEPETGRVLWQLFVQYGVMAYVCSHILAFDVQVHQGVLQILTAGAGTAHRMPEGVEYLHCIQGALDEAGLRYQVLDTTGTIREWLTWPLSLPPADTWPLLDAHTMGSQNFDKPKQGMATCHLVVWEFSGICHQEGNPVQTLLSGWNSDSVLAPLWIGLLGPEQRLSLLLAPTAGRSPHLWCGPTLAPQSPFSIQVAIHTGMGPGGFLWRWNDDSPWSSLIGASARGAEQLVWPMYWGVGHAQRGKADRPFQGSDFEVRWYTNVLALNKP